MWLTFNVRHSPEFFPEPGLRPSQPCVVQCPNDQTILLTPNARAVATGGLTRSNYPRHTIRRASTQRGVWVSTTSNRTKFRSAFGSCATPSAKGTCRSAGYPFPFSELQSAFTNFGFKVSSESVVSCRREAMHARGGSVPEFPIQDSPNQALEPTSTGVTPRAYARAAPPALVAHL